MKRNIPGKQKPLQPEKAKAVIEPVGTGRNDAMQLWFLILFSLAIYSNTLFLRYTLDDALMITENTFTKKGINGLSEIMSNDAFTGFFGTQKTLVAGGRYRPLSQLMFAVEFEFFGLNPFIGHLVNILLYALGAGLLFLILKKFLPNYHHPQWYRSLPWVATLLFICHPIHTEVVANIKGRDEILTFLGSLLSLYLAQLYIEKRKIIHLILLSIVYFLALMAKENAITFLLIIPLTFFFFKKISLKDYASILSPLVIGTIAYLLLRYRALGYLTSPVAIQEILNDPYVHSSLAEKLSTNMLTWGIYLKLLLFPHPLTHDYYPWAIKLTNWGDARVILTLLTYLGLLIVAIRGLRKRSLVSYAIWFFFITFSISSNIVFNIGTFMNERFMFMPLLGFTLAVAYLITQKLTSLKKSSGGLSLLPLILIILLALGYSVKTFSRNFTWKDDFTLFTTDVKTSANSAKCNVSAGGMYINKARSSKDEGEKKEMLEQAEKHLRHAISIYSGNSAAWVLLGNVYLERKNYEKASEYYLNCLNIANQQTEALTKLRYTAYTASKEGQMELAIRGFKALIKLQPDLLNHYIQLSDLYSKTGKADTALVMLESLLVRNPGFADAYGKIGEIYGRVYNQVDKSLEYLLKALEADPKSTTTMENLGICYGLKQDFNKSIEFFNKALEQEPDNARLLQNISNSYHMMGNTAKAEEYLRRATEAEKK